MAKFICEPASDNKCRYAGMVGKLRSLFLVQWPNDVAAFTSKLSFFIIHLCGCAHKKAHKAAKKVQKYVCLILRARYCTATVHASSDHRRSHGSMKSTFAGKYFEGWVMKLAVGRSMEIHEQIWVPPCDLFSRSFPSLKARHGGYSQA